MTDPRIEVTVWVLFLKGESLTTISVRTGLRRPQVNGIVNRSPYRNRAAMTLRERQDYLDALRIDCGSDLPHLVGHDWKAYVLSGRQSRD